MRPVIIYRYLSAHRPGRLNECSLYHDGLIRCSCEGFIYRHSCWHHDEVALAQRTGYAPRAIEPEGYVPRVSV